MRGGTCVRSAAGSRVRTVAWAAEGESPMSFSSDSADPLRPWGFVTVTEKIASRCSVLSAVPPSLHVGATLGRGSACTRQWSVGSGNIGRPVRRLLWVGRPSTVAGARGPGCAGLTGWPASRLVGAPESEPEPGWVSRTSMMGHGEHCTRSDWWRSVGGRASDSLNLTRDADGPAPGSLTWLEDSTPAGFLARPNCCLLRMVVGPTSLVKFPTRLVTSG